MNNGSSTGYFNLERGTSHDDTLCLYFPVDKICKVLLIL